MELLRIQEPCGERTSDPALTENPPVPQCDNAADTRDPYGKKLDRAVYAV